MTKQILIKASNRHVDLNAGSWVTFFSREYNDDPGVDVDVGLQTLRFLRKQNGMSVYEPLKNETYKLALIFIFNYSGTYIFLFKNEKRLEAFLDDFKRTNDYDARNPDMLPVVNFFSRADLVRSYFDDMQLIDDAIDHGRLYQHIDIENARIFIHEK